MRPFKFFFVFALAIFAFSFIAKFFIMAFLVVAVMTTVFFIFKKIRDFFFHLTWDGERYDDYEARDYRRPYAFAERRYQTEPLFYQNERRNPWESGFRSIKIH